MHGAWPALYRTAYLLVGDAALAEDLVQTAMAKTYAAWPSVRVVKAAPGFARTTMVNTAASWFRKRSWRNEVPTASVREDHVDPDPSLRPTVLGALELLPSRPISKTKHFLAVPVPPRDTRRKAQLLPPLQSDSAGEEEMAPPSAS